MATIDLKLKSYDELQFEIMRLNTDNYLKQHQIDQLTNNWNELKEWLKDMKTPKQDNFGDYGYTWALKIDVILDKMKEIKGGNNVSSRD